MNRTAESSPAHGPLASESTLVAAAARGDRSARQDLLVALAPLISGIARRYQALPGVEREELLQEGAVGVLTALERYDPAFETPFWAYASWWVRQAMQRLVSQLGRSVVLSDRALRELARIADARRGYLQSHGREPRVDQLAAMTQLSVGQIASLTVAGRTPKSLDEPRSASDESVDTVADHVRDPKAHEAYDRVLDGLEIRSLRARCAGLSDRERHVVCAHFGLGQPAQTLRQIGKGLGISAERVRQIQGRALDVLREDAEWREAGAAGWFGVDRWNQGREASAVAV